MANTTKDKVATKAPETLESQLRAREGVVLGMSADVTYAGDDVRIVFGGVAGHERISLKVSGDSVSIERG